MLISWPPASASSLSSGSPGRPLEGLGGARMEPIVITLEDRRRELVGRFEAIQQAIAAILLILAASHRFSTPTSTELLFAGVLLLASVLLLGASIQELRGTGAKRRIPLRRLRNAKEVCEVIVEGSRSNGIEVRNFTETAV
jgi:hypothetical protein